MVNAVGVAEAAAIERVTVPVAVLPILRVPAAELESVALTPKE
jgi:hypothetical protein